jgi:secondary thiamine-phosphate synthase enzyme
MLQQTLRISTKGKGFTNITDAVASVVEKAAVSSGICSVFIAHTSASLVIQENADPAVLRDLERFLARLVPELDRGGATRDGISYEHDDEGPDDMPAHIRSALTKTNETIPIANGRLALGTWQGLYLWEHRTAPHDRCVLVTVLGPSL